VAQYLAARFELDYDGFMPGVDRAGAARCER
jgi:hypothetical protein